MSKAKTIKEVLIATRWIQDRLGWCQHQSYQDAEGKQTYTHAKIVSCCFVGALSLVEKDYNELHMETVKFLRQMAGWPGDMGLASWNDEPGRTKAEVLDLLDRAIQKSELE